MEAKLVALESATTEVEWFKELLIDLPMVTKLVWTILLHCDNQSMITIVGNAKENAKFLSYPVFMPKPSTHRINDPRSIVPYIWPKVFTDNHMSRIKYNYYISNVSKDYDDSQ
jgi:hypothetical protein